MVAARWSGRGELEVSGWGGGSRVVGGGGGRRLSIDAAAAAEEEEEEGIAGWETDTEEVENWVTSPCA